MENDTFNFCILLSNRPTTRRGILSTVSSVFDPLGFVAPFILEGKKILQELCKDNVGWDEPVSETISTRWLKWRSSVQALSKFIVDRCYHPKDFGQIVTRELHHFSDANTKGYVQSTYFRLVNNKGDIHCSFVMGKARVTPLKPMTMPRLELTAALVSTRVSEQIKKELPLEYHSKTFWTDSKVVLGYVKNESRRFQIFVANRVQEIQEKTSPEQWRYVDTTSNPADIASRGISANRLLNSAWIQGPEFLWKSRDQWPSKDQTHAEAIAQDDPEVRKSLSVATSSEVKFATLEERLRYFSSWHRAKRAIALCIRYMHKLKAKKHSQVPSGDLLKLTVAEMQHAETVIIRAAQASLFETGLASWNRQTSNCEKGQSSTETRYLPQREWHSFCWWMH